MLPILFLIASTTVAGPADLTTFADWTVGCDNGRACHATSLMPEKGDWDQSLALSIRREPEGNAAPVLTLIADGGKAYRLRTVAGTPIRIAAGNDDYLIDRRDQAAALSALRSDSHLLVETAAGAKVGEISLAGVSAAMLYMDDRQTRIGRITALVRTGSKPAAAVSPPPPLPVIRAVVGDGPPPFRIPATQIAALRKRFHCQPYAPDAPGYDAEQATLAKGQVLLLLGCGAGAYNFSSIAFVASKSGPNVTVVPAVYDHSPVWGEGQPMLVNAEWDPKAGLLGSFAKGRGLGDCGTMASYVWDGRRMRLAEQSEMKDCRGSMDYITTWRTRVITP